jgi:hypothetical protein
MQLVIVGGRNKGVVDRAGSILGALHFLLSLAIGQFDGGEPLIRQVRNKILIIIIRFEAIEGHEVGPAGWSGLGAGKNGFEQVVVDHMKLGANMICPEVPNEPDRAGMERRGAHVLSLSRPRLPLGYLSSILEPRL